MNTKLVSIVRCDRTLARKAQFAVECDVGVPVSISNAIEYAIREYLLHCSNVKKGDFPQVILDADQAADR